MTQEYSLVGLSKSNGNAPLKLLFHSIQIDPFDLRLPGCTDMHCGDNNFGSRLQECSSRLSTGPFITYLHVYVVTAEEAKNSLIRKDIQNHFIADYTREYF